MGRIKQALRNLSLRKSFMLYMLLFLLLATLLSSLAMNTASNTIFHINLSYGDIHRQYITEANEDGTAVMLTPDDDAPEGQTVLSTGHVTQIWSVPLFLGLCAVAAALLFYRSTPQNPIARGHGATRKIVLFLLLAALLISVSISFSGSTVFNVHSTQEDTDLRYIPETGEGNIAILITPDQYSPEDKAVISICHAVETWSIPLFFGLCIIAAALLFYRNKLQKPIALLDGASQKIAGNDLDFTLRYDSRDEMGQLCGSFETMRAALLENNRALWRTAEERKRLNAAFSHDLRTPLTVLRGYADFLRRYVPGGKLDEDKVIETVSTMSSQIDRLEAYVKTMSEIQKLEDIEITREAVPSGVLAEQLERSARMLSQKSGRSLTFANELHNQPLWIDPSAVQRVCDNLLSNAVRYATDTVTVRCRYENQTVFITVEDDGPGFSADDLPGADKPYYRQPSSDGEAHFGLGLFLGKTLCEKHGGTLTFTNKPGGSARITASFLCPKAGLDKK